jgi:hypothetical protein
MLAATITVDGVVYRGAGIKFRGDRSYKMGLKRNPFGIQLDYSIEGQQHQGYAKLKLSSALRDPSMIREMLFSEIAGKYLPTPNTAFTRLYINDAYTGVFILVENPEKAFLETHYGSSDGSFYEAGLDEKPAQLPIGCRQNIYASLEYEENVDCYRGNFLARKDNYADIQELTRILEKEPAQIDRILDVDRTLWMHALNNTMVNLNSYSGNYSVNYFLFRDKNGRFQPIHWDFNLAFGSYKNTGSGSDLDLNGLQELDPLLHMDNLYKPLISQLLRDPFYKKIYLSHLAQINRENFINGQYLTRARALQGQVVVAFNDDPNKTYSPEDFQKSLDETVGKRSKIPGIAELMSKRSLFLKNHADLSIVPPIISQAQVQSREKFEQKKLKGFSITARAEKFPKRILVYYRFGPEEVFRVAAMSEKPSSDLATGEKLYTISIDTEKEDAVLEYYLMSENPGAVYFLPNDYMRSPFKARLVDLNK